MASVFKRGGRKNRDGWYYAAFADHNGKRRTRCTRSSDRSVALRIAKQWEADAALRREGVIDPALEAIADESQRTTESHLTDYEARLQAAHRSPQYIAQTLTMIRAIASAESWSVAADIDADGANHFAGDLRERNQSARTIQAYIGALKGFTKWLVANSKLPRDPLASVAKPNPRAARKRRRRMLLPDEWAWLRDTLIEKRVERHGMTAEARMLLYATAIQTGLRSAELRSLTKARLFLDGSQPYITCSAGSTKNRKAARQFIQPALAAQLRDFVRQKAMAAPVFAMPVRWEMADMLRADLAEARSAWIKAAEQDAAEHIRRTQSDFLAVENDDGAALDFHALRHTCGAWLAIAGAHANTVRAVMRHSSITLTFDTYGHLLPGEEAAGVAMLPAIMPGAVALEATGTADDALAAATNQRETLETIGPSAQRRAQRAESPARHSVSSCAVAGRVGGTRGNRDSDEDNADSGTARQPVPSTASKATGETRTPDLKITNHAQGSESLEEDANSADRAAQGAAHSASIDLVLQRVVDRWETLPVAIRAGIAALVDASE